MYAIKGFHLVRFGTPADQKFLLGNFLSTYDQLIINANMIAYMTSPLATFISVKSKNKPYLIDPQTHAFQHDIKRIQSQSEKSKGKIKRSIKKLIDAFGEPIAQCILKAGKSVLPENFNNSKIRNGFCRRVIKFQLETIPKELNESDAAKYYKYVGLKTSSIFSPTVAIAPYFYLSKKRFADWLKTNVDCAIASKNILKSYDKPLGVQIVISQDVLADKKRIDVITAKYSQVVPDVFFIWVDDFSEQEATEEKLLSLVYLINNLGKIAPVVNLYGSFFSVVLGKYGITPNLIGVSHGLEYGESRSVVPVGGGFPTAKFYYPKLHIRLIFRDAFRAVRASNGTNSVDEYHNQICNCKMCKEVIINDPEINFEEYGRTVQKKGGRPYPATETKDKTVAHYMWCKKREYRFAPSKDNVIQELNETKKLLGGTLHSSNVQHCKVWSTVLSQHSNKT